MKLKSLEIQGFKTFSNKTKIDFVDGISAVVGPNGSGKSNVSDAIRWALGEQSAKNLRCSKMEDVIFAGSEKRKIQGFASVSIIFDNKEKKFEGLSKEFSIMRKYNRSGESEYFIDMKPVRLKDINDLFMDTGLGKDGYSIIGQGTIEDIIRAKPSQRREIFEEAAGISGCRYKKEMSQARLQKAEENLVRVNDILEELEARVGPLKKQSDNAQVYLKYSERKKNLEVSIWVKEIKEQKKQLDANEEKLKEMRIRKSVFDIEAKDLEKKSDENFNKNNDCVLIIDGLRRSAYEIEENISKKRSRIMVLENSFINSEELINKNKENIEKSNECINDLENEKLKKLELVNIKKDDLKNKMISLENDLAIFNDIQKDFLESNNQKLEIEKHIKTLEEEKNSKNIRLAFLSSSIGEFQKRFNEISRVIVEKKDLIKKISVDINASKEMEENLNVEMQKIFEEIKTLKGLSIDNSNNYHVIDTRLREKIMDAENISRKIKILEELDKNMDGVSGSVKSVIKAQKNGELKGIHGKVADVFKVSKEYCVAIDVALGGSCQNIVTDNDNCAKKAIEFLKKGKLGRATFLPISTIKGSMMDINEISKYPGVLGLASDLCECEEKYVNIKNYLLGRCVIVSDIEKAIYISSKCLFKFKLVTLDGQVVNPGGSLTGGSFYSKTGLISRISEINDLNIKSINIKNEIEDIKKELEIAKIKINENQKLIEEKNKEFEELKLEKEKFFSRFSALKSQKEIYEENITELSKEIEEKKLQNNSFYKEKETLENEIQNIDLKIKDEKSMLTEKINCSDKFLERKNEAESRIQKHNLDLVSMKKELEFLDLEMSVTNQKIKEQSEKIEMFNKDIDNLKKSCSDIDAEINQLKNDISILEQKKESIKTQTENLKLERENLELQSIEIRKKEKDIIKRNEELIKEVSRLEERRENIMNVYDERISRLWDSYNLTFGEACEISKNLGIENVNEARKELTLIKSKIKNLGQINISAIEEYKEVNARYTELKGQVDDIEKSKIELLNIIGGLSKDMKNIFMDRFKQINNNFSQIIKELFGGGNGQILLESPDDILSSGIDISVKIPGKNEISLEALSGGEKALVAISLYFAIIKVNPPPFCVLDEIEAALDDVNVDRFARYLRKICDKTQFIVISHRRGTMEEADILYGVTMEEEGVSKVLELKINEVITA